jgi:hypothetical protein
VIFLLKLKIKKIMKANEVRIGNFIFKDAKKYTVNLFTISDILIFPNYFRPIKINEKWLLALGFKLYSESDYRIKFELKEFEFFFPKIKDYHREGLYFRDVEITKIKYVHQLQNLYFVLTGEELDFIGNGEALLK